MAADSVQVTTLQSAGSGMAVGCTFSQINDHASAFRGGIGGGAGSTTIYVDCYFDGSFVCSGGIGIVSTVKHIDTRCAGAVTVSDDVDFLWEGGEVAGNIIVQGSTTKSSWAGRFRGSVTVGADTLGYDHVITNTGGIGGGVTVASIACAVSINGDWTGVTFSGTPTGMRRFDGSSSDIDFTGPGHVNVTKYTLGGGTKITLRGSAVTCFGEVQAGGALSAISLTHSLIVLGFGATGSFTFDAGSSHNLAVIGGTHQGTWGGTTNGGAFNRIITEIDDTLTTASTSAIIQQLKNMAAVPPGEDGEEGPAGPPGRDGTNGARGLPGLTLPGQQGPPGEDGVDGTDGVDGRDGKNGTNGARGLQGLQGPPGEDGEDGADGAPGKDANVWKTAWGWVAEVTWTTATTGVSAIADVTGASLTFTAVANRRYKYTISGMILPAGANASRLVFTDNAGTEKGSPSRFFDSGLGVSLSWIVEESGLSGSITRKLRILADTSTTQFFADNGSFPGRIMVEDIGPSV